MKYKILLISEKDLVSQLEIQSKMGFEICEFLDKVTPNASSDFSGWKILFRSIRK